MIRDFQQHHSNKDQLLWMLIGAKNKHDPIMATVIFVQNRVLELIMYSKGLKVYFNSLRIWKLDCNRSMYLNYLQIKSLVVWTTSDIIFPDRFLVFEFSRIHIQPSPLLQLSQMIMIIYNKKCSGWNPTIFVSPPTKARIQYFNEKIFFSWISHRYFCHKGARSKYTWLIDEL